MDRVVGRPKPETMQTLDPKTLKPQPSTSRGRAARGGGAQGATAHGTPAPLLLIQTLVLRHGLFKTKGRDCALARSTLRVRVLNWQLC